MKPMEQLPLTKSDLTELSPTEQQRLRLLCMLGMALQSKGGRTLTEAELSLLLEIREDAYRKYATAAYADAYLFTVFTRILEVACDREEAEVRLNQSLVGDPEHDLYNLYGHPQIAIMKE